MQFNPETVTRVMFADPSRSVVYGWSQWPVRLVLRGEPSEADRAAVEDLVAELNDIVSGNAAIIVDDDLLADVFMVFSPQGHELFEEFYGSLFIDRFGREEFDKWKSIGGFTFPFIETNPCFGFGLYHPEDFTVEGFVAQNSPSLGLISIGRTSDFGATTREACIREELAHLIYYIPDFVADHPDDTIFNANALDGATESYSEFDIQLMDFLFHVPVQHADPEHLRSLVQGHMTKNSER